MNNSEKKKQIRGLFPKFSLMDALKIAQSIRNNHNMHPYNRLDLASSVNYSPNSSSFRLLIISSNSYGLTKGGYQAEKISLTELGKSIVAYTTDSEKNSSLKSALFNIPLFKNFFTKFDQGQLPRRDLLMNSLNREYNVPLDKCGVVYDALMKNAKELGILKIIKGTGYIRMDLLSQDNVKTTEPQGTDSPEEDGVSENEVESPTGDEPDDNEPPSFKPKVFISHSKNKKIVEQIKQILKFGQFEYVIAEETETTAIPISEKVFGLMKQCNCAIINLSVDDKEEEDFEINQNVLTEIGAAFLQYNKKVILLVDKRIAKKMPSNLNDLYRSEYQGDELTVETALKLQKALSGFRKE